MIHYFTDPVLAAPTIGSMLMCMIAAFVGTFCVLKERSLVGEALSHACYPGVICSLIFSKLCLDPNNELGLLLSPLVGAAVTALLGMYLIHLLTSRCRVYPDSALCFILASFFGVALVLLSSLQTSYPTLYRELQGYLFGQAATQTTIHIQVYAALTIFVLGTVVLLYRPLKMVLFDPEYARTQGVSVGLYHGLLIGSTVLAVVVGIRSLGVVLMSSMLIFPAVSARFWSVRLERVLVLALLYGAGSGFFGVYLSHELSQELGMKGAFYSFPTGPMIVLVSAAIFFVSCFFSPKRGLFFRLFRKVSFYALCRQENLLKLLWKECSRKNSARMSRQEIAQLVQTSTLGLDFMLASLAKKGWVKNVGNDSYELTASGMLWGRKIVRLHRLWEVYLAEYLGVGKDRVHPSAEEMEHIITPEIERELEALLNYPMQDPHQQPIPKGEVTLLQP